MQYRFRYQPRSGTRVILDVPARAEVALAFDGNDKVDFDIIGLFINEIAVPWGTGLSDDVCDFIASNCASDIRRILADAGKNATAVFASVG